MRTGCMVPIPRPISARHTHGPLHSSSLMLTSNLPSRYQMKARGDVHGQSVANEAVNLEGKWHFPRTARMGHTMVRTEVGLSFSNP